MKTFFFSIVGLVSSHLASAQLAPADDKAIRAVIAHWDANLNNHRFQEIATYTTEGCQLHHPGGNALARPTASDAGPYGTFRKDV